MPAHIFSIPDIFDYVDKVRPSSRGEFELTDALNVLIGEGSLSAYQLSTWMDVGYPWDMLDANAALMETIQSENRGFIEEGVTLSGPVIVGEGHRS